MPTDLEVICYFDGPTLFQIVAELHEYRQDPTRRLKVLRGHGTAHDKFFLQACTDTDGGTPGNDSHPCPGSPGC